jgi:hypothetical protein
MIKKKGTFLLKFLTYFFENLKMLNIFLKFIQHSVNKPDFFKFNKMSQKSQNIQKWRKNNPEKAKEQTRKDMKKYVEVHKDEPIFKLKRKIANKKYYEEKIKNKQKGSLEVEDPYKTSRAKSKAVKKVKENLPRDNQKAASVIQKLSKDFPTVKIVKAPKSPSMAKKEAKEYFLKDTTSTMLPGKKDVKTFIINGEKKQMNVRVLQGSLREHFKDFKSQNNVKIGYSTFVNTRPVNVKTFKHMPHYSCLCKYHENVKFLFDSIRPFFSDKLLTNHSELVGKITCAKNDFNCMNNICKDCSGIKEHIEQELIAEFDGLQEVKHIQWENIDKRPSKTVTNITLAELVKKFSEQLYDFKVHSYVHHFQSKKFEKDCKEFTADTATFIFDFSEKYSDIAQDEIQSAYFKRSAWSIFTGAAYIPDIESETVKCTSYGVISDEEKQDKFSTFSYMKSIMDHALKKNPHIKFVNIWTDGASSQFKNIYTISNIMYLEWLYDIKIRWFFHATSHGKCIVDGIGGNLKNVVFSRVKSQKLILNSAHDFFLCAEKHTEGIEVLFVDKQEVKNDSKILKPYFNRFSSNPINRFRSCHYFEAIGNNQIKSATIFLCDDEKLTVIPAFVPPAKS